jgi:hypothetical protein
MARLNWRIAVASGAVAGLGLGGFAIAAADDGGPNRIDGVDLVDHRANDDDRRRVDDGRDRDVSAQLVASASSPEDDARRGRNARVRTRERAAPPGDDRRASASRASRASAASADSPDSSPVVPVPAPAAAPVVVPPPAPAPPPSPPPADDSVASVDGADSSADSAGGSD